MRILFGSTGLQKNEGQADQKKNRTIETSRSEEGRRITIEADDRSGRRKHAAEITRASEGMQWYKPDAGS